MKELHFIAVKAGYILLFLGLTLLQVFSFPGQFKHMRSLQGFSLIVEVYLILFVGVWLCCGQAAIICLWHIVESIRVGQFFTPRNIIWIRRLLLTFKVASAIPIVLIVLLAPQAEDPGFLVLLSIVMLFILSLTLTTSLLKDVVSDKVFN